MPEIVDGSRVVWLELPPVDQEEVSRMTWREREREREIQGCVRMRPSLLGMGPYSRGSRHSLPGHPLSSATSWAPALNQETHQPWRSSLN